MGRCLSWLSPPMVLNFTPEQMWNPKILIECLKDICPDPGKAGELQFAALYWGLTCTYYMSVNATQYPQGKEVSESNNYITDTVAKPQGQQLVEVEVSSFCKGRSSS